MKLKDFRLFLFPTDEIDARDDDLCCSVATFPSPLLFNRLETEWQRRFDLMAVYRLSKSNLIIPIFVKWQHWLIDYKLFEMKLNGNVALI